MSAGLVSQGAHRDLLIAMNGLNNYFLIGPFFGEHIKTSVPAVININYLVFIENLITLKKVNYWPYFHLCFFLWVLEVTRQSLSGKTDILTKIGKLIKIDSRFSGIN